MCHIDQNSNNVNIAVGKNNLREREYKLRMMLKFSLQAIYNSHLLTTQLQHFLI